MAPCNPPKKSDPDNYWTMGVAVAPQAAAHGWNSCLYWKRAGARLARQPLMMGAARYDQRRAKARDRVLAGQSSVTRSSSGLSRFTSALSPATGQPGEPRIELLALEPEFARNGHRRLLAGIEQPSRLELERLREYLPCHSGSPWPAIVSSEVSGKPGVARTMN